MIVYNRLIPFGGFEAMAIWPFIFTRQRLISDRRRNHEKIHLRQQFEVMALSAVVLASLCLTCIPWWWMAASPSVYYLLYAADYAVRTIAYRSKDEGYRNICFEQEAVMKEYDFGYIKRRRAFAWTGYIRRKTYSRQ